MEIRVPYGKGCEYAELPEGVEVEQIELPEKVWVMPLNELIAKALERIDLKQIAAANSLSIVVSDISRPMPNADILEQLWLRLEQLGMTKERITIFIASGLHKPASREEIRQILGDFAAAHFRILAHDADDKSLQYLGFTSRGTQVKINSAFMQSEFKLAIGLVQPHQIAGFSGGAKSIAIGLGGKETITANHALLDHPACQAGNIKDNPARQEIEEIGQMVGLDFLINVISDARKKPIAITAGKVKDSYSEAVAFAREFYCIPVKEKKDLVVVSPGGYPKDANLYQAQKALNAGVEILKPGGVIVLVANCSDGAGNQEFIDYLGRFSCPQEVLKNFKKEPFAIGPHKAYIWAKKIAGRQVLLVSDLEDVITKQLMVECVSSLPEAVARVKHKLHSGSKIGVLPHASLIIPKLIV